MDTINERKKTFTFYYTSSILLKGWIERAGSRMKGQVLYKPKHNKTISQQSPDAWLFAFFICCCTDTFVGVYNTIEKCVLVQLTWNRILEFQKNFFVELVVYIHKTPGTKIHTKSIFMKAWWERCFFSSFAADLFRLPDKLWLILNQKTIFQKPANYSPLLKRCKHIHYAAASLLFRGTFPHLKFLTG